MLEDIVKNRPKYDISNCELAHNDCVLKAAKAQKQLSQYYDRIICGIILELIEHVSTLLEVLKNSNYNSDGTLKFRIKHIESNIVQAKIKHYHCDYINALKDYYDILKQLIYLAYQHNIIMDSNVE